MSRFTARAATPHQVIGHLSRYTCRTISDCDAHLTILRARLPLLTTPQQIRQHREDLDLLLDRRLWLQLYDPA